MSCKCLISIKNRIKNYKAFIKSSRQLHRMEYDGQPLCGYQNPKSHQQDKSIIQSFNYRTNNLGPEQQRGLCKTNPRQTTKRVSSAMNCRNTESIPEMQVWKRDCYMDMLRLTGRREDLYYYTESVFLFNQRDMRRDSIFSSNNSNSLENSLIFNEQSANKRINDCHKRKHYALDYQLKFLIRTKELPINQKNQIENQTQNSIKEQEGVIL
ncbi:unnamed protein product [Paramecium octaurelia]|uniref:Uncharacterized protein n=1 Tax=Paramecium octaurelia TaxID=43137 RepID=A0A8S1YCQ0_PAROT|nr:unnamed protein product [Paramecium octaurelia]